MNSPEPGTIAKLQLQGISAHHGESAPTVPGMAVHRGLMCPGTSPIKHRLLFATASRVPARNRWPEPPGDDQQTAAAEYPVLSYRGGKATSVF